MSYVNVILLITLERKLKTIEIFELDFQTIFLFKHNLFVILKKIKFAVNKSKDETQGLPSLCPPTRLVSLSFGEVNDKTSIDQQSVFMAIQRGSRKHMTRTLLSNLMFFLIKCYLQQIGDDSAREKCSVVDSRKTMQVHNFHALI